MLKYVAPIEQQLHHIAGRIPKRSQPNSMTSHELDETTGQRLAEHTASILGSWRFIGIQAAAMAIWILINTLAFLNVIRFDAFPFVFLNLTMSAEAAFTGPILLIAANVGAIRDHKQYDRMERMEAAQVTPDQIRDIVREVVTEAMKKEKSNARAVPVARETGRRGI